jgi:hypothetical protein
MNNYYWIIWIVALGGSSWNLINFYQKKQWENKMRSQQEKLHKESWDVYLKKWNIPPPSSKDIIVLGQKYNVSIAYDKKKGYEMISHNDTSIHKMLEEILKKYPFGISILNMQRQEKHVTARVNFFYLDKPLREDLKK